MPAKKIASDKMKGSVGFEDAGEFLRSPQSRKKTEKATSSDSIAASAPAKPRKQSRRKKITSNSADSGNKVDNESTESVKKIVDTVADETKYSANKAPEKESSDTATIKSSVLKGRRHRSNKTRRSLQRTLDSILVQPSTSHKNTEDETPNADKQIATSAKIVQETIPITDKKQKQKKKKKTTVEQKTITSFFPARRSTRKTESELKRENREKLYSDIRLFYEKKCEKFTTEEKGEGVRASSDIEAGEFVCEYTGDLITLTEAKKREAKYSLDKNLGSYMMFFSHKEKNYCVDATLCGRIGRFINHSKKGANLALRKLEVENQPRILFFALRNIKKEEELGYDYGDRSKKAIEEHPWLAH